MTTPLTYRDAGVDIDRGNRLIARIGPIAKRTRRPGVMGSVGGFGGLFEVPSHYQQPVLVSGTDGVGTKLRLAVDLGIHDTIGIDLVAMCVNDILTMGAEPLFFLDYYATGRLDEDTATSVIAGIGRGCELAGAALIGGETAEMPGMYQDDDYDLAGFCVGVVEKSSLVDGRKCTAGDVLIGLPSSGPHSNGYSLIRKIIEVGSVDLGQPFTDISLGEALMKPTRIYVKSVLATLAGVPIKAMAHITGGGITENLPRVIPPNLTATVNRNAWTLPPVFKWIQSHGAIETEEMLRTFNCGVGMVLVVGADESDNCLATLVREGEQPFVLGELRAGAGGVEID